MKKAVLMLSVITGTVMVAFLACNTEAKKEGETVISNDSLVKRGSYIVSAGGCDDCHTPKKMGAHGPEFDMDRRLSGHPADSQLPKADSNALKSGWILFAPDLTAYVGPWGTSYSANLTSDPTGTGNWTEEQFMTAIKKGKSKGIEEGRPLLPPMPWEVIKNLNDTDLKAIFAFLKTTKPIANLVPGPKPPGQY
jgi:cytochrome c553